MFAFSRGQRHRWTSTRLKWRTQTQEARRPPQPPTHDTAVSLLFLSATCVNLLCPGPLASRCPGRRLSTWPTTGVSCPTALGALRSADVSTCVVPPTLSSYGDRTFAAAGPRLWNSLPVQLRNPDITYGLFRRQLKGHLIREAFQRRSMTSDMRRHRKTLTYLLTYLDREKESLFSTYTERMQHETDIKL